MKKNRGFKYRIYPDEQQKILLQRTFGCCRFVYNKVLEEQVRLYDEESSHMSKFDSFKWMTTNLKPNFLFLKEVDSLALMNAVFSLNDAYTSFFKKKAGFPKFKSKRKGRQSYTTSITNDNIHFGEDYIVLPKIGMLKAVIHRLPPVGYCLKSATVSRNSKGNYYCSLLFEYEAEEVHISTTDESRILGLDYKSDGLYVDSEGNCADMPKYFRSTQDKLAKAQKMLSMKKGFKKSERKSHNYIKQQKKVNKLYVRSSNQRKDFLHKKSTAIAKQYDFVIVEGLDMKEIASAESIYKLGKATNDNGFGMFRNMLAYKLKDKGGALIETGRWFASSQKCSYCGTANPEVKDLSVRTWQCPCCGAMHDRDINAAINEKKEGIRLLKEKGITITGDSYNQGWDSPLCLPV